MMLGPDVYMGGQFENAGGKPEADFIARWGTVVYKSFLPLTIKP